MKFNKDKINKIIDFINNKSGINPTTGIICGSGITPNMDQIIGSIEILFSQIPGFPVPSVKGHSGRFILGKMSGQNIIVQEGRLHLYEGLPFEKILLPLYVMEKLGIKTVIITNAAGGINPKFKQGQLMAVKNHINFTGSNPLVGISGEGMPSPFIDMSEPYDNKLLSLACKCASKLKIPLKKGVYIGTIGPNYETTAETSAFRKLGADAVSSSLVPEAIFARYLGIRILAFSIITNIHKNKNRPSHDKVICQAKISAVILFKLINEIVKSLGQSVNKMQ